MKRKVLIISPIAIAIACFFILSSFQKSDTETDFSTPLTATFYVDVVVTNTGNYDPNCTDYIKLEKESGGTIGISPPSYVFAGNKTYTFTCTISGSNWYGSLKASGLYYQALNCGQCRVDEDILFTLFYPSITYTSNLSSWSPCDFED